MRLKAHVRFFGGFFEMCRTSLIELQSRIVQADAGRFYLSLETLTWFGFRMRAILMCKKRKFYQTFNSRTYPTKPGHFSRSLAKGPNTTTWIWNLHADAHDFDSHTSDLEEISRKVFSAHFGQLGVIFIWLSGCDTMMYM